MSSERKEDSDRIEMLMSRLVGGEAAQTDWIEFTTEAESDTTLWRRLALAQRDQEVLAGAVNTMVAVADAVSVPAVADVDDEDEPVYVPARRSRWKFPMLAGTGWAAAAVITFIAVIAMRGTEPNPQPRRIAESDLTPEQAVQQYLEVGQRSGQVVGEIPTRVLVDARPLPDGGYVLLYQRRFLETQEVPDLDRYQFAGHEENGQPTFIRHQSPQNSGGM
jgi:hypothetical protein